MKKKKRFNLPMDENLMKYVPKSAYQRIYEKSVQKYELFSFKGDEEQFTATPAPMKRSWMPIVVSLCACAVMGMGVFTIHEINLHKIDIINIQPQQEIIDTHTTVLPLLPSMDLTQAELYFLTEQSGSDCYTISAESQAKLADYIKETSPEWTLFNQKETQFLGGFQFQMYVLYNDVKSIVYFFDNGTIVQSFPELEQTYYWGTDIEFFYQHLTNKTHTMETKIPIPDGKTIHEADSVEIMNYLFQREKNHRSAPFFNILNKDYTGSNKMIVFTNTAYAPNLFFIPDKNLQSLSDAFEQGEWEEIANDSVIPDGEGITMYVYRTNQGKFSVTFYPLNQIAIMKNFSSTRTFRISDDIITAMNSALDLPNEYFVENLIPCEMSEPENRFNAVWTAVDDYTETHVDLSAYQEIADRINEEYNLNMQNMALVTRENYSGEAGYFSYIIYHILLSKTPEEFEAQMRESAEAQLNYKPEFIPLDAEKIFSVTYNHDNFDYELNLTDEEKAFICEKINQAEWNSQFSSDFVYDDLSEEFEKSESRVLTIWTVDGDQQKKVSLALDTPDRVVQWQVGRDVAVANITGYSSLKDDSALLAIMDKLHLDDASNLEKSNPKPQVLPISPQNVTNTTFRKMTVTINGNNVAGNTEDTELNLTSEQIETICDILNHAEWNAHAFDDEYFEIEEEYHQTEGRILEIQIDERTTQKTINIALDTPSHIVEWWNNNQLDSTESIGSYDTFKDESTISAILSSLPIYD
ncbi:MAG: hypothetical protein V3G42_06860 [Oscillospiraceae bacterium]